MARSMSTSRPANPKDIRGESDDAAPAARDSASLAVASFLARWAGTFGMWPALTAASHRPLKCVTKEVVAQLALSCLRVWRGVLKDPLSDGSIELSRGCLVQVCRAALDRLKHLFRELFVIVAACSGATRVLVRE